MRSHLLARLRARVHNPADIRPDPGPATTRRIADNSATRDNFDRILHRILASNSERVPCSEEQLALCTHRW